MAIVERAAEGFSAFFPGLPCCFAIGDTLEQLRQNAEGAVFDYLELSLIMRERMTDAMAEAVPHTHAMARMFIEPRSH